MASIEQEIKQSKFANERVKANINVMFTANCLGNRISSHLKPFQLTHEQFNVLRILRGKHPEAMCQKDILERMVAPKSNVTLILQKLKAKKLVTIQKSDVDNRAYVIHISKAGLDLLQRIDAEFKEWVKHVNNLTEAEARQLNLLLDKLRG